MHWAISAENTSNTLTTDNKMQQDSRNRHTIACSNSRIQYKSKIAASSCSYTRSSSAGVIEVGSDGGFVFVLLIQL